jgi:hypothetical protein
VLLWWQQVEREGALVLHNRLEVKSEKCRNGARPSRPTRDDLRDKNLQLKMRAWPAVDGNRDCLQWKSLEDQLKVWQWTAEELVEEAEDYPVG